ncbi:hypothetical protein [Streptomyces sp. NPDC059651]|uniref:hypothetical protein n=1 Tax=Streptomyces sp. NPDC059651 TaxID=3346897 RepID=UPI003682394B
MAVTPWQAGMRVTAGGLNAITATWSTWTPTWTTTSGIHLPSLGNASVACDYCQTGDLVTCSFDIQFGSTTNFGASVTTADNWLFSLPVTSGAASGDTLGFVSMRMSDPATLIGRFQANTSTTLRISVDSGRVDSTAVTNTGIIDSLSPWTWANGHTLHGQFQYRAA